MTTASATTAGAANAALRYAGSPTTRCGYIADIVRHVLGAHAVKTFADVTGISLGAANKKVHGQRAINADELAAMLRDERGFELLTEIMADAQPKWWVLCSAFMSVRDAQQLQAEARTKLRRAVRGALDADTDLSAAIARAEAFSDADFHRPYVDALRGAAGVPDSAVAAPGGKGRGR